MEVPLEVHKDNTAVSPHQSSPTLMPPLQFFNEATHRFAEVCIFISRHQHLEAAQQIIGLKYSESNFSQ